jgi:hypothetical protein
MICAPHARFIMLFATIGTLSVGSAFAQDKQAKQNETNGKEQAAKASQAKEKDKDKERTNPVSAGVDDLAEQPDRFIGKTVRVRGDIEEVLGAHAFTLDEDSLSATEDVLVMVPQPAANLGDTAQVTVTGEVIRFVRAQFERDYDGFDLDPDLAVRYERRPVIVAESIRSGGKELIGKAAAEDRAAKPVQLSASAIAKDPQPYYGRRVSVQGEIEDVLGANTFTIDEDAVFAGPDVLVVTSGRPGAITDGAEVKATGTLRRLTWAELRRDFDWLELDRDLIVAFENRPILIADSVYRASRGDKQND